MSINSDPTVQPLVICANVFIKKEDVYLMLKRSAHKEHAPNYIHPVGGKADQHENPYEAAMREVKEETGLHVTNIKLEAVLLELCPVKNQPEDWLVYYFSADYESGEMSLTDEGELLWLSREEITRADLIPSLKLIIQHILEPTTGTVFGTVEYDAEKKKAVRSHLDICVR